MDYILAPKGEKKECIFCDVATATEENVKERLVVHRGESAYVVLNRYPFAAGHLLVIPYDHVDSVEALDEAKHDALMKLVRESVIRLRKGVKCEGLNVGMNLGAVAGAGVAAHLHVHIVPRWSGDMNFMPVLADTRVIPQALEATRDHLAKFFSDL